MNRRRRRVITLLTDFGTCDWFVGTLKGVILGLQPQAGVIDLTHEVPPGDLLAGAVALRAACRFFQRGTIHVAVVDPGVGSARPAIVVETRDYFFVGPDNGILSLALRRETVRRIHRLERDAARGLPQTAMAGSAPQPRWSARRDCVCGPVRECLEQCGQ